MSPFRTPCGAAHADHAPHRAALIALTIFALGTAVSAAEAPVDAAFDRAEQALHDDPDLSPRTREAFSDLLGALRDEHQRQAAAEEARRTAEAQQIVDAVDQYMAAHDTGGDGQLLDGRLKIGGDFRLRHESTLNRDSRSDRHRQRIRGRLGATWQPTDEFELGGRIVTGDPEDAGSANATLGDGFDKLEISLDRAYVAWTPRTAAGLFVTAGKFAHPFYANPVYGNLVWNSDVQPEGVVIGLSRDDAGPLGEFTLVGGVYNMLEQNGDDACLVVAQAHTRLRPADNVHLDLAFGVYHYNDPTPDGSLEIIDENAGNATLDRDADGTPDAFVSDFTILNPIAALQLPGPCEDLPLTLSGEFIHNLRARNGLDSGYAAGVKLGRLKAPGSWQAYYQWQVVEQDAVFSPYASTDFSIDNSNYRGHVFGWKTQVNDFTELHLWALIAQRDKAGSSAVTDGDDCEYRLRADLIFKF